MSLYTPVFPPTDTPPEPTSSSSSLSSVEAQKHQRTQSYSSRLAQWHLAIASLPYELCPPSSPPSPGSQARSANLQSEIEKAVRKGRNITDFCKLRSTKLGYATKQPSHETSEQGERIPWLLAETEEEWFQWERKVAQRRVGQKGKDRALNLTPPPATLLQNAHDKVLSWKASLLPPSASPVTASPAPSGTANTVRSSLGFPVVKPSTLARGNRLRPIKPATQSDLASRPNSEARTDGDEVPVLRADSRIMTVDHADTGSVKHDRTAARPPLEANQEDTLEAHVQGELPGPYDFSVSPPPSFPLDLVTSTQKDGIGTVYTKRDPSLLPPIFPADETNEVSPDNLQESQANRSSVPDDTDSNDKSNDGPLGKQVPQPTPPSPPYSSETPPQPARQPHIPPETAVIRTSATPPLLDRVQPLTPPPETGTGDNEPVSNEMQSSFRTPEPPRRQPSGMKSPIASQAEVLSGVIGIDKGKAIVTTAHTTPDAAINGASAVRGNLFPRTPERKQKVLSDPLTTSRKSRPRPRPPSRKRPIHNVNMDLDGGVSEVDGEVDLSPTKSERSYFSSPASGSSSDSGFSRGSLLFVPGSPTSPLGGFTQQPTRFAPLAHSTQVTAKRPSSPTPLHARTKSKCKSQSQSQSQRGVYDSQFDVDARVDQVSNFMRQDVDLDAWIRATDTEADDDDDDFAVEEMTRAPISSISSR